MLQLSPPYRIDEGLNNWENVSVLTVLHAFFGFIEFYFGFSVLDDFFYDVAVSYRPQCPPQHKLSSKDVGSRLNPSLVRLR